MVQKKKKTDEAKSKSATTLPKTNSDVAIARITSDSKLLDPPSQYEEEEMNRKQKRCFMYKYSLC